MNVAVNSGSRFDESSANGTFINDQQLKGETTIKHDDILKVGPLTFKVAIESSTPVSKPTPVPGKLGETADDDVAAMLLSLQDDGGEVFATADESGIPGGSTVMDIVPLNLDKKPEDAKPAAAAAKKDVKKDTAHQAAKALLDKYTRRPRT